MFFNLRTELENIVELVSNGCKAPSDELNGAFLMCCDKLIGLLHHAPKKKFDELLKEDFWSSNEEYCFFLELVDRVVNQTPLVFDDATRGILCRYVIPIELTAKKDDIVISHFIPDVITNIISGFISEKTSGLTRDIQVSQNLVRHLNNSDVFDSYHLYSANRNICLSKEDNGDESEFLFYGEKLSFVLQINIVVDEQCDSKTLAEIIASEFGDPAKKLIERTLSSFYFFNRCSFELKTRGIIPVSKI